MCLFFTIRTRHAAASTDIGVYMCILKIIFFVKIMKGRLYIPFAVTVPCIQIPTYYTRSCTLAGKVKVHIVKTPAPVTPSAAFIAFTYPVTAVAVNPAGTITRMAHKSLKYIPIFHNRVTIRIYIPHQ